jgi:ribonuclease HII
MAPDARSRGKGTRQRWKVIEKILRGQFGPHIAGIDEVGRGPLAGPVVACAVVMPPNERAILGVDDSKRLSAAERQRLAARILEAAVSVGVGAASVREIDRVNIYHATVIAMRRALRRLSVVPNHVLIDGKPIRTLEVPHTAIVGGDGCCYSIACASIIAKVTRDRVMRALAGRYPKYRWEHNVGYSTMAHLEGMVAHGITPHHRRSFIPVRQLSLDFSGDDVAIDLVALQALASVNPDAAFLEDDPPYPLETTGSIALSPPSSAYRVRRDFRRGSG